MALDGRGLSLLWERIREYIGAYMEEWEELSIANDDVAGMVRPDGVTTSVDEDGTMHAITSLSIEESDPTVPEWAKRPEKPTYTADEVGALPDYTTIPTRTSQLDNDSGFVTSVPTATELSAGVVRPDGTTITVDQDGTIHGAPNGPRWEVRTVDGERRLVIVIPEEE